MCAYNKPFWATPMLLAFLLQVASKKFAPGSFFSIFQQKNAAEQQKTLRELYELAHKRAEAGKATSVPL